MVLTTWKMGHMRVSDFAIHQHIGMHADDLGSAGDDRIGKDAHEATVAHADPCRYHSHGPRELAAIAIAADGLLGGDCRLMGVLADAVIAGGAESSA